MSSFTHLHTHSNFSLLDGTIPLRDLVERTKALRMSALALTDHNGLYGAVEFYQLCQAHGLKPSIGAQVSLTDGSSLVLLVKNTPGYRNLCEIISTARLRGGHLQFRCEMADIVRRRRGLIVLSGGKQGRISQLLISRNFEEAEAYTRWMQERFGDDFFLELQHFLPWDDLLNDHLQEIARRCGVPLVATNDVHLLTPQDLPLRRVLHAIDQNTLRERVRTAGHREQYLKSPVQMHQRFARFPEALENTQRIAERCHFEFTLGAPIFPVTEVPEGESRASYLRKLCEEGARERYRPLTAPVRDRLQYELEVIDRLGFNDYFLIVKDIVDFCRHAAIPCVGRGSAADSLVAYVLGITFADPVRFNLYFERFLNPERTDAPDIDLDICWKNRDRVLNYVYEKYGADKTAMICTFSTFQSRAAVREVAKTFGLPEEEITRLTRALPYMAMDRFEEALQKHPELKFHARGNATYTEIFALSKRLANFPRHLSIHSGGVIIAPDRLTHYTSLEIAGKGLVISQYDMHTIERLGLVKMDLLGVRSLSIITACLELTRSNRKPENQGTDAVKFAFLQKTEKLSPLDLRSIPERDPETIALIKSGQTLGCFQLESPLIRGILRKMQTDSIEDTVAAVAVIRPGVGDSGMKDEYILRRGGVRPARYPHPIVEPILRETYGLTIYQEQLMLIAQAVAGFSLAQADTLRRVLSKHRNDKARVEALREQFIAGARKRGLSTKKAEEVWTFLIHYLGFGFNKAHAATYGILAYQTAFLKRYFPVEYMTAVLNNPGGFYARAAYIEECRRMRLADGRRGISLLPPDLNRSDVPFTIEGDAIRAGLDPVAEVTERTKKKIVEERQRRPFKDLYDFLQRSGAGQKEAEHLIRCGALRRLHPSEPLLLMKTQSYFKSGGSKTKAEFFTQNLDPPPYARDQRILAELEMLDFAVTDHPLTLYDDLIPWEEMVSSLDLEAHKDRRVQFTGWYVTSRLQETATGAYMKFLSLEDRHGIGEIIFFPEAYEKYADILHGHGPFTVVGNIQSRMPGEANLIAEKAVRWMTPWEAVTQKRHGRQLLLFAPPAKST